MAVDIAKTPAIAAAFHKNEALAASEPITILDIQSNQGFNFASSYCDKISKSTTGTVNIALSLFSVICIKKSNLKLKFEIYQNKV